MSQRKRLPSSIVLHSRTICHQGPGPANEAISRSLGHSVTMNQVSCPITLFPITLFLIKLNLNKRSLQEVWFSVYSSNIDFHRQSTLLPTWKYQHCIVTTYSSVILIWMTIAYGPTISVQIMPDVLPIKLWMTMKMSILWFQKLHRAFHWFVSSGWHCLAIDLDCYRPQFLQNLCKNFHDPQKKMGQWSGRLWGSSIIFLLQVFQFTFHP